MKDNKDIDYIAKHYQAGHFAVEPALRRIRPEALRRWTPMRIAAALVAAIVLSATAAVLVHNDFFIDSTPDAVQEPAETVAAEAVVRVIDFEEAPLPVVVEKIKDVYGVEVTGLPENAEDYILSLHYEGSATDLLETINDILETDMTVKK